MRFGDVERLVPGEELRISVRRHAACLTWPVGRATLAVAALLATALRLPDDAVVAQNALWWAMVAVLGHLAVRLGSWWVERLEVTTQRMLLTQGLVTRTVTMMPLRKVTDLTFTHTPFGRLLGYATMSVESAGADQALSRMRFLPWGEQVRHDLTALVFTKQGAAAEG